MGRPARWRPAIRTGYGTGEPPAHPGMPGRDNPKRTKRQGAPSPGGTGRAPPDLPEGHVERGDDVVDLSFVFDGIDLHLFVRQGAPFPLYVRVFPIIRCSFGD